MRTRSKHTARSSRGRYVTFKNTIYVPEVMVMTIFTPTLDIPLTTHNTRKNSHDFLRNFGMDDTEFYSIPVFSTTCIVVSKQVDALCCTAAILMYMK